jgi:hypothetical protein
MLSFAGFRVNIAEQKSPTGSFWLKVFEPKVPAFQTSLLYLANPKILRLVVDVNIPQSAI